MYTLETMADEDSDLRLIHVSVSHTHNELQAVSRCPPSMGRERKLNELGETFESLEYPIRVETAAAEFDDVTLLLADGERNLGSLVAKSDAERFETASDVTAELHNHLPREAVGEPFQSEGEG